jgi:hypothetical protein
MTGLLIGCSSENERLAEFAQQATEQQARQNEEMARQSRQVAEQGHELAKTAQSLVEQDAAARREMIQAHSELQSDLQEERTKLDTQRQELHVERQEVAKASIRDPVIAQAILATGLVLAALLPLVVTAYALRRLPDPEPTGTFLADTLIENLDGELRLGSSCSVPELPPGPGAPLLGGPGRSSNPGRDSPVGPAT